MNKEFPQLYRHSLDEARHCNEIDEWRESHRANLDCVRAIENAINRDYSDNHLAEGCAKSVIDQFGFDRVNYILAVNTQLMSKADPRLKDSNREWGNQAYIPRSNLRYEYRVNKHAILVDGFISQARAEWDKLGLFDSDSCIESDEPMDYTGKLLILSPNVLKDQYKTPEDQLFYATGGFGCDPSKMGRKVFGFFLKDGEETHFARGDFLGVIKDECIPDWAYDKLNEYEEYSDTEDEGMGGIS